MFAANLGIPGAFFLILQACLGLEIDGVQNKIVFTDPFLPPFLTEIKIERLRIGKNSVDLEITRYETDVGVKVLRRDGRVNVIVAK